MSNDESKINNYNYNPKCFNKYFFFRILHKHPLPKELLSFNSKVLHFDEYVNQFFKCQSQVLYNFFNWSRTQEPMRRPLFKPSVIPCFIPLQELQYDAESFSPRCVVYLVLLQSTLNVQPFLLLHSILM